MNRHQRDECEQRDQLTHVFRMHLDPSRPHSIARAASEASSPGPAQILIGPGSRTMSETDPVRTACERAQRLMDANAPRKEVLTCLVEAAEVVAAPGAVA